MFFHLIHDDKFIDVGFLRFEEAFPGENIFILTEKKEKLNFIKKTPIIKLTPDETVKYLKANYTNNDKIIIHFLRKDKVKIINKLPKGFTIIWIGWGADYYHLIYSREKDFFLSNTFKWVQIHREGKKKIFGFLNDTFGFTFNRNTQSYKKAYKRIRYINTVIDEDYKLIKKRYPNFKPRYLSWNYGNMTYLDLKLTQEENTKNILLGNSADPTNNHIEILDFLKNRLLHDSKIICPLSYGDKEYAVYITQYGKNLFGENFMPLIDYLPIEEYYKIIASCSVVFMNHLRQQAVGNILTLLLAGSKIIFQDKNPLYLFFIENGFCVNSFQEIERNPPSIYTPLTPEQKETNKQCCIKIWNDETALKRTLNFKNL